MQQVRFIGYVIVLTLVGGFVGAIIGIYFDWTLVGVLGGLLLGLIAGLQMAKSSPGGLRQRDGGDGAALSGGGSIESGDGDGDGDGGGD